MSSASYTEKMQHAIRVFTVPLPTVVILGVLFTIVSTFLARHERFDFWVLIVASVCIVAVALITAWGNIPINNQIKTWSINAPPSDWAELAQKWWWFQTLRMLSAIGGLSLLTLTTLVHRE
jgi:energy-coupling factor transporter transmembrane protein EcfT